MRAQYWRVISVVAIDTIVTNCFLKSCERAHNAGRDEMGHRAARSSSVELLMGRHPNAPTHIKHQSTQKLCSW